MQKRSVPKTKRNQNLVRDYDNTDMSFKDVGKKYNISPQRAWVIYSTEKSKRSA